MKPWNGKPDSLTQKPGRCGYPYLWGHLVKTTAPLNCVWGARQKHLSLLLTPCSSEQSSLLQTPFSSLQFLPPLFPPHLATGHPFCSLCARYSENLYHVQVRILRWESRRASLALTSCAHHQDGTWCCWKLVFLLPQNQSCSFSSTQGWSPFGVRQHLWWRVYQFSASPAGLSLFSLFRKRTVFAFSNQTSVTSACSSYTTCTSFQQKMQCGIKQRHKHGNQ